MDFFSDGMAFEAGSGRVIAASSGFVSGRGAAVESVAILEGTVLSDPRYIMSPTPIASSAETAATAIAMTNGSSERFCLRRRPDVLATSAAGRRAAPAGFVGNKIVGAKG